MQARNDREVITDFFGQGYRVSGTFVGSRPLAEVVYDGTTSYLLIKDAYLSPINDPATISNYYATALLNKVNLDFVLTAEAQDGLRRDQRYTMGRNTYQLFLTVPFFEITGELHTNARLFNPRSYLSQEAASFITLLNVVVKCTFRPDVQYQGGAALISRDKISFFGEKASPK